MVIGQNARQFFPEKQYRPLFDVFKEVWAKGKTQSYPLVLYKNAKIDIWMEYNVFILQSGDIVTVFEDLTAQKQAEEEKKAIQEQLYQAQKMESIGRLAGGIAHDFNNILVGIMGYAELLKMQFPDRGTYEGDAANVILSSAERAAELTKRLLGFARKGKFNPVLLNANEVIRDMVKVSEKIYEKNIDIIYDFDENIRNVEVDRH